RAQRRVRPARRGFRRGRVRRPARRAARRRGRPRGVAARARGGAQVTRGGKIGLGIAGTLIAVNVGRREPGPLTGGTPGGPRSSSYATGDDGLAAYASLLSRAGHNVRRVRTGAADAGLSPRVELGESVERLDGGNDTVVLLDPSFVSGEDAKALRDF